MTSKACVGRITAKGHGDCEPYYFDLLKCIDKCVRPLKYDIWESRQLWSCTHMTSVFCLCIRRRPRRSCNI
jgi:hypothetical protein